MTLPASGAITLAQVNTELGLSATAAITLNDAAVRSLFVKPSGAISLSDGHGKSNRTYATLNPAMKAAAITLSNGNLSYVSSADNVLVLGTIGKTSGKWYWEVTATSASAGGFGVGYSNATLEESPGSTSKSQIKSYSGRIIQSNSIYYAGAPFSTGAVLGFAYDADAETVAYYLNGALEYTSPSFGAFDLYPVLGNGVGVSSATANFGASPFVYTPPAGFNAGLYL